MEQIQQKIEEIASRQILTDSQMFDYIKPLAEYAKGCDHITEMGVAIVTSTWAFLSAKPKRLVCVDIDHNCPIGEIREAAARIGVDFEFVVGDTNHGITTELNKHCTILNGGDNRKNNGENYRELWEKTPVPYYTCEPTDLLFIDTYHHYVSLKYELTTHSKAVSKYIILHDTISFGTQGEGNDEIGLQAAVKEFLAEHPQWTTEKEFTNYPGLYVMKRIGSDTV